MEIKKTNYSTGCGWQRDAPTIILRRGENEKKLQWRIQRNKTAHLKTNTTIKFLSTILQSLRSILNKNTIPERT